MRPGDVASEIARVLKWPARRDPARNEFVESRLGRSADEPIHYPPADLGVGSSLLRRIDVDASEQCRLRSVEKRVVERLVRFDLRLVSGQIGPILLVGHRR